MRAPIPQKQELLIERGFEAYPMSNRQNRKARISSVFDGFRNFGNEAGGNMTHDVIVYVMGIHILAPNNPLGEAK